MSAAAVTHGKAGDNPSCPVCQHCITEGWTGIPGSHCRSCGREWGPNGNEQHCTQCHRNFSTVAVADRHRVDGACHAPESMVDKKGESVFGWRDTERGRTYTGPSPATSPWSAVAS